ncbi:MAG: lipocalin family protein [Muribaculaceae bacterium]
MKKKFLSLQSLMVAVMCVIMSLGVASCSDDDDVKAPENAIVGTWRLTLLDDKDGDWFCQYEFRADGTLSVKDWSEGFQEPSSYEADGKWTITGGILTIEIFEDYGSEKENYRFSIEGDKLIIYDYDGEIGPNVFYRIK